MKCLILLLISVAISASALNVNVQKKADQLKSSPIKKTNTVQNTVSQNTAAPTPDDAAWEKFKKDHGKTYPTPAAEAESKANFLANLAAIKAHSRKLKSGSGAATFTMGINKYSDVEHKVFAKTMNGLRKPKKLSLAKKTVTKPVTAIPPLLDWTTRGVVTPVKDQGGCGSCWAFSATGALEARYAIKTKKMVRRSEQFKVDCVNGPGYYSAGCDGGLMTDAFAYVAKNGDFDEGKYPYKTAQGSCKTKISKVNKPEVSYKNVGFREIPSGDENGLLLALQSGPVSVGIDASSPKFQQYSGGRFIDCGKNVDHGVLVVGTVEKDGQKCYKVKNSWGTSWGEKGYVYIPIGKNTCGIAEMASYPIC